MRGTVPGVTSLGTFSAPPVLTFPFWTLRTVPSFSVHFSLWLRLDRFYRSAFQGTGSSLASRLCAAVEPIHCFNLTITFSFGSLLYLLISLPRSIFHFVSSVFLMVLCSVLMLAALKILGDSNISVTSVLISIVSFHSTEVFLGTTRGFQLKPGHLGYSAARPRT